MDLTCSLPLQKLTRCERSKSWVPQNWLSPPLTLEGLEIPYPIPEQHLTLPTRCSDTDSVTTSQQPASLSLKGKTSSLKTRFEIAEAWCRLLTRFWPEGRLHSEQHPCWGCVYATTEVRTFGPSTLCCFSSTLTKWLTATKENHHDDLNTEKNSFFQKISKSQTPHLQALKIMIISESPNLSCDRGAGPHMKSETH